MLLPAMDHASTMPCSKVTFCRFTFAKQSKPCPNACNLPSFFGLRQSCWQHGRTLIKLLQHDFGLTGSLTSLCSVLCKIDRTGFSATEGTHAYNILLALIRYCESKADAQRVVLGSFEIGVCNTHTYYHRHNHHHYHRPMCTTAPYS